MTIEQVLQWLDDPTVFQVNRMNAHSDHSFETPSQSELIIPQNGKWRFSYYQNLKHLPRDFFTSGYDDSNWDWINVPGHIQMQGYGHPQYTNTMYPWDGLEELSPPQIPSDFNPVGLYSHYFKLPDHVKHAPIYISFQGVESCLALWCNGHFVGYSEDSFTPAEFDLTPYINSDENRICAMVIRFCSGSWLEDQDFWRFSGIFRDVYLYTVPKIHIYDMNIKPIVDANLTTASLSCDYTIQTTSDLTGEIWFELNDRDGVSICKSDKAATNEQVRLSVSLSDLNLWSDEMPYLYHLKTIIQDHHGNIIETVTEKIGFRRFELKNKLMYINGKRIVFRGVNRHEFNPQKGRSISADDVLWDIKCMKRNNINAVRTSHYPNLSLLYRLCDEYGLYVIDEANIETHGSWMIMGKVNESPNKLPENKMEWLDCVIDRGKSMLERDKNHPSILIWSCGNESYGGKVLFELAQYYRQSDPSRLVHYEGIFFDRSYPDTSDMESRMYTPPEEVIEYLENDPAKPFILCEYSHAMGNSCGNLSKYIEIEEQYPLYQGGFIWDFIDQAIESTDCNGTTYLATGGDFGDHPNDAYFCGNGLVFANRIETPKMQEVKFLYQPVKLIWKNDCLTIVNKHLWLNTDHYTLVWSILKDGVCIETGKMIAASAPQTTVTMPIPITVTDTSGEIIVDLSLRLKEDTRWEKAGYEVAFGQGQIASGSTFKSTAITKAKVIDGDVNIGFKMDWATAMFWKTKGLTSITSYGKELLTDTIRPNFWRAPVDNDFGNGNLQHWAQWKIASLYNQIASYQLSTDITDENGIACHTLTMLYHLNIHPSAQCTLTYCFYTDNKIKVTMDMDANTDYLDLPAFGFSFPMPAAFNSISWYGNGPLETQSDRKCSGRLGIYHNQAQHNFVNYLNPQHCGNKTDLRWIEIKDSSNVGIKISSDEPFECTVSPYCSHQLELAHHANELPPIVNTFVHVTKKTAGVAGDNSWGAPIREEYLLKTDQPLSFQVWLELI